MLGSSLLSSGWRRLQLEWLGGGLGRRSVLRNGGCWGSSTVDIRGLWWDETRGIGRGLGSTQLGEVEIVPSLVAQIHGLAQTVLGVETVEDDGVDQNHKDLNDDLDDGADQHPVLHAADELIVNRVGKVLRSQVLGARPTPQVLTIVARLGILEQRRGDNPQDEREGEEADGEH